MIEFMETLYKTMEALNAESRRILDKEQQGPSALDTLRENGILIALGLLIFDKEKTGS